MAESQGPRSARREISLEAYVAGVRARDVTILPRAMTLIESGRVEHQKLAEDLLTHLLPYTGHSIRVGITGVPGVGKSTFIEALGMHLVRAGHRVAVLAVDPSSNVTGGSILGDKTRMTMLASESNAFIRPSPTAGTLGGIARKTRESMLVCEAAGYDVVLIETVGVGQSETTVADITDCFLALMLPGAGDELQGIKRGLLELVDVIAVNKADGPMKVAAQVARQQYEIALRMLGSRDARGGQELPRVLTCSALTGDGVGEVWSSIAARQAQLERSGELESRRRQQALRWMWSIVQSRLEDAVESDPGVLAIRMELERAVLEGRMAPEAGARRILDAFGCRSGS